MNTAWPKMLPVVELMMLRVTYVLDVLDRRWGWSWFLFTSGLVFSSSFFLLLSVVDEPRQIFSTFKVKILDNTWMIPDQILEILIIHNKKLTSLLSMIRFYNISCKSIFCYKLTQIATTESNHIMIHPWAEFGNVLDFYIISYLLWL